MSPLLWLATAWLPFLAVVALFGRPRRPGAILLGTVLAALAGGMCSAELRRHGVLAEYAGGIRIPPLDLRLHEVLRFALAGLAGALAAEGFLNRLPPAGRGSRETLTPEPPPEGDR